eukprot:6012604-Pyramimonas_sp.AAC.1
MFEADAPVLGNEQPIVCVQEHHVTAASMRSCQGRMSAVGDHGAWAPAKEADHGHGTRGGVAVIAPKK